jgi:hypothetical protein
MTRKDIEIELSYLERDLQELEAIPYNQRGAYLNEKLKETAEKYAVLRKKTNPRAA